MVERVEQIERELRQLVSVVTEIVPSVREIRVFGSYNNGHWNPKKSDVDVFVGVDRYRGKLHGLVTSFITPNPLRRDLLSKDRICKKVERKIKSYQSRFSLLFFNTDELEFYGYQTSPKHPGHILGEQLKKGRLIYPNKFLTN